MGQLQEDVDKDLVLPQNMAHLQFYIDVSDLLGKNMTNMYVVTSSTEGCRVVSALDSYGHNLGFLDQSRYFFFQVVP
jgi:hypothetical protein